MCSIGSRLSQVVSNDSVTFISIDVESEVGKDERCRRPLCGCCRFSGSLTPTVRMAWCLSRTKYKEKRERDDGTNKRMSFTSTCLVQCVFDGTLIFYIDAKTMMLRTRQNASSI